MKDLGILVVSFGTTYIEAIDSCIRPLEAEIAEVFRSLPVYRAFASKMVRKALLGGANIHIDSVEQALLAMKEDGIRRIIIQPSYIIQGTTHEMTLADIKAHEGDFDEILVGKPLLTDDMDYKRTAQAFFDALLPEAQGGAVLLVGHGTDHAAHACYTQLQKVLHEICPDRMFITTLEGAENFAGTVRAIKNAGHSKVLVTPLLLVAGDHAHNDITGSSEDSVLVRLTNAGFEVLPLLRGLGEYPKIRNIFIDHVRDALGTSSLIDHIK